MSSSSAHAAVSTPVGEKSGDGAALPDPGGLSDHQIAMLRSQGEVRATAAGQVLFREGDRGYEFFVILSGLVQIVDHQAGRERQLVTGGPGEFIAELNLLTGERLFTTAVVKEPGELLRVPVDRLQALISRDQELGDLILRTTLARRQWLADVGTGLRIVGFRSARETRMLAEFASRNRIPHTWLDPETDPAAHAVLAHHDVTVDQTPIVVMRGGDMLIRPSNVELARAAGLGTSPAPGVTYDVAIIGAGPAGLAAAIYGASEGLTVALVDALAVGGQIATTSKIENYLGFPVGISGREFAQRAFLQALRFGASIVLPASATAVSAEGSAHIVHLDTGDDLRARALIISTGSSYRRLDASGADRFAAAGVFYTPPTAYDGVLPSEPVIIVGGGNSAGQAALALDDAGSAVTIVIRGADLRGSMSRYLTDRIASRPGITICSHSAITGLYGEDRLESVGIQNLTTTVSERLPAKAVFVMIGTEPHTEWLARSLMLDYDGYIVTGPGLGRVARRQRPWVALDRDPYLLETSVPGVFAAGDVRSGSVKRAASAVGEGSIAARFVSEHLGTRAGLTATTVH